VDALKNNQQSPPANTISCEDRADYFAANNENKAWDKAFNVYYQGALVGECQNGAACPIPIQVSVDG
jgi:hypothetical protein